LVKGIDYPKEKAQRKGPSGNAEISGVAIGDNFYAYHYFLRTEKRPLLPS
jgi:hypothetical protein